MSAMKLYKMMLVGIAINAFASVQVSAQFASSLLNEGAPLAIAGSGAQVSSVLNPRINRAGGWAFSVSTTGTGTTLSHVYGTPDGIAAPALLRTEGTVGLFVQTSINSGFGIDNAGQVIYRAVIDGPTQPTVFIDDTLFVEEETVIAGGPLAGFTWDLISSQQLSVDGVVYHLARVKDLSNAQTEHLMRDTTHDVLLSSGQTVPGLPQIMDDDSTSIESWVGLSAAGTEYIVEITMDTTNTPLTTSNDNAMVVSGKALFLGGAIVQENQPVPAGIGGLANENWDNFDVYEINEFGDILITGDTIGGPSAQDEFLLLNDQIILREGDVITAGTVGSSIEQADLNEQGDWAVMWDIGSTEVIIVNGDVVVSEGDAADGDGDGILDAAVIDDVQGSTSVAFGGLQISDRDSNGDVTVYAKLRADGIDGGTNTEGIYKIVVPVTPFPANDVEISIEDFPDPQTNVPGDIEYKIRVRNKGATAVGNTVVEATIDPTLSGLTASVPVNETSPNVLETSFSSLAAYETKVFTITGTATTAGIKTSSVEVTLAGDPNLANNTDSEDTSVGAVTDLEITITDDVDPLTVLNGNITYTVEVTNNGPSDATNVAVVMNLDANTTYVSSDPVAIHNGVNPGGVVNADITGPLGTNGPLTSGSSLMFDVTVQATGSQGTLTADATVTGDETDPNNGNNSDSEDTTYAVTADLAIEISDATHVIGPGDQILYTVTVTNNGPSAATGVVADIMLDTDTTFVSTTPPGMLGGPQDVTTDPPQNLGIGANFQFDILVDTNTDRYLKASGIVAGNEPDPDVGDNTTAEVTAVFSNFVGSPTAILSTIATDASSDVPGVPGQKFTSFETPVASPNGENWLIVAEIDRDTHTLDSEGDDDVLIRSLGGVIETVVEEGPDLDDLGDPIGFIDEQVSINNSGDFAFTTNHDPFTFNPQTNTEIAVKNVGGVQTTVTRMGAANLDTFQLYYFDIRSPLIQSDGSIWFYALMGVDGPPPNFDFMITGRHIYDDDGAGGGNVQFQTEPNFTYTPNGMSIPGFFWTSLDRYELTVSEDQSSYLIQGVVQRVDPMDNTIMIKDVLAVGTTDAAPAAATTVVIEEGIPLAGTGFVSPVDTTLPGSSDATVHKMMPNGDWWSRGQNEDDQDWVLRNGAVMAKTGDPIHTGSTEAWSDSGSGVSFFVYAANNVGDFVIGGVLECEDAFSNAALVLNGERIVARENDPVDLDGNGLFDDDLFIQSFGSNDMILSDDGKLRFVVNLRDSNATSPFQSVGSAFAVMNVNCPGTFGDLTGDDLVNGDDIQSFVDCVLTPGPAGPDCICADFTCDGEVTLDDLSDFIGLLLLP
ncbi:MAG: DUF11 domain-containing protein [Phycisphaerales bacterium]|nr:DUF11 domain-containing protein [Phycisphaerales bacterium]